MALLKKTLVGPLLLLALLLVAVAEAHYDADYDVEEDFEEHGSYSDDNVHDIDPEYDDLDAYDEVFTRRQLQTDAVKAVCQVLASKKRADSEAACLQQCGQATTSNDEKVALRAVEACLLKGVLGGLEPGVEKPKKTKSTKPAKAAKPVKSKSTKPKQGGKKQKAPGQEKAGRKRAGAVSAGTDGFNRVDMYDSEDDFEDEFDIPRRQLQTDAVKVVCQHLASKKRVASEAACLQQCGKSTGSNDAEVALRAVEACLLKGVLGGLEPGAEKPKKTKSTKAAKPAKPAKSKSTKAGQGGKKQKAPGQEKAGRKRAGAFSAGTDGFNRVDMYDSEDDFEDEFDIPRRQLQTDAVKEACQYLAGRKKVASQAVCLQQCGTATLSNDPAVALGAVDACLLKGVLGGLEAGAEKPKKAKSTKAAKPAKPAKSKSTKAKKQKAPGQEKAGRKRAGAFSAGTDGVQRFDSYEGYDEFDYEY